MTADGILGFFASSLPLRLLFAILSIDLLKGGVLVLLAWLAARLLLRDSPGAAHTLWSLCLLSLLALPPLWLWLPPLRIGWEFAGNAARAAAPLLAQGNLLGLDNSSGAYAALAARSGPGGAAPAASLLAGLWLAGVLAFLARLAAGALFARRMAAMPASPLARSLAAELAAGLALARPVELATGTRCGAPFTHGILAPRILLPEESSSWTEGRLRAVLLHELAHVRSRDTLTNAAAGVATAVLWCVPFAWMAAASMRMAQEKRADMAVLGGGIRAAVYASDLLELGRRGPGFLFLPGPRSAFGRKSMMKERIKGILDLAGRGVPRGRTAAIVLAAFCLAASMSMATCSAGGDRFLGSWLPEEGQRNPFKYEFTADGKAFAYNTPTAAAPGMEGRLTIEKRWKDAQGASLYNVLVKWSEGTYDEARASGDTWHVLMKIDPSGKRMESQANTGSYTKELYPENPWYGKHRKQ